MYVAPRRGLRRRIQTVAVPVPVGAGPALAAGMALAMVLGAFVARGGAQAERTSAPAVRLLEQRRPGGGAPHPRAAVAGRAPLGARGTERARVARARPPDRLPAAVVLARRAAGCGHRDRDLAGDRPAAAAL